MDKINFFGFDMDYTLAGNKKQVDLLIFYHPD